jgi:hypothetical protein
MSHDPDVPGTAQRHLTKVMQRVVVAHFSLLLQLDIPLKTPAHQVSRLQFTV